MCLVFLRLVKHRITVRNNADTTNNKYDFNTLIINELQHKLTTLYYHSVNTLLNLKLYTYTHSLR